MPDAQSLSDVSHGSGQHALVASRADTSRQQILAVAARLLRERGYAETSLRDIAAAVGMKAGSLYYHFESKELLAAEVLRIGVEHVHAAVACRLAAFPADASHRDKISGATLAHLEALLAASDFSSAHIRCFPYVPPAVKESVQQARRDYDEIWAGLFERALADGALRDGIEPRTARHAVLGALNFSLEWFDPAHDEPGKFAEMLSCWFLD